MTSSPKGSDRRSPLFPVSRSLPRTLQAELLDSLAPDDPAARASRRDLRVINRVLGNHRWFVRALRRHVRPGERVLEIGAGAGELCRELVAQGWQVDGLDRAPRPAGWPAGRTWHQVDLRAFDGYGDYDVVVANLILHHLTDAELAALGRRWARGPRVIVACEPARLRRSQSLFAALSPVFGAHAVTRHDGRVSIAAGFVADELTRSLGLAAAQWELRRRATVLGMQRLVAVRRS
jgi:2-polyprenyl-3-methyl-5-hydroxy-6-metoxy-1,4-benzoquinol methylase